MRQYRVATTTLRLQILRDIGQPTTGHGHAFHWRCPLRRVLLQLMQSSKTSTNVRLIEMIRKHGRRNNPILHQRRHNLLILIFVLDQVLKHRDQNVRNLRGDLHIRHRRTHRTAILIRRLRSNLTNSIYRRVINFPTGNTRQLGWSLLWQGTNPLRFEFRIHQHFHRFNDALARSAPPFAFLTTPSIRAQKLAFRPLSAAVLGLGAGAFKWLPVAALYFARPFSVSPAPSLTESFSPRPTAKETPFFIFSSPSSPTA